MVVFKKKSYWSKNSVRLMCPADFQQSVTTWIKMILNHACVWYMHTQYIFIVNVFVITSLLLLGIMFLNQKLFMDCIR